MALVLWLTGLSGSGKTTLAEYAAKELSEKKTSSTIIDGDDVRDSYPEKLGFSKVDILKNNRYIVELCQKKSDLFDVIFVPVISPYEESRAHALKTLGKSCSIIYLNADLASVEKRDVKGLYKKARAGIINNMIGLADSNPYQVPSSPDLILSTGLNGDAPEASLKQLLAFIEQKLC
ncbi:MAG: adenylyl-sulfate kinase [Halobacteriovoraceae bacterium]|jgi:adenylylsulfate kinase|nr:adenylyl-sulfate kinase [Halobacteriovoraceae bacterium]MBT5094665.1 adenylyl-sulfate kinase [Halobacteriovoraceae bacterium]